MAAAVWGEQIVPLSTLTEAWGERVHTVLLLHDLTGARVVDGAGADVVPTPASVLSADIRGLLTTEQIAALDAGDAVADWPVRLAQGPGETQQAFVTRIRASYYPQRAAWAIQYQRDKYSLRGNAIAA